ncbi:MAG: hypothetical protein QOI06_1752 [Nocardioidaceae bacterium]|nr:hypothetical protein [Nocardioidaceae bacterium]
MQKVVQRVMPRCPRGAGASLRPGGITLPSMEETLAASTLCVGVLTGPRTSFQVSHRGADAWHLRAPSAPLGVSLLSPRAVRFPQGLVVSHLPTGCPEVSAGEGALWYDDRRVTVSRWLNPPNVLGRHRHRLRPSKGVESDRLASKWRSRLGRGEGLTPYGDDVLCGALLGLLASGDPRGRWLAGEIRGTDLRAHTTATSAVLLRCAADGWCLPELDDVLQTIRRGRPDAVAVSRLLAVGHSSGHGLLTGLGTVLDLELGLAAA